jgi:hypothetical protein
MKYYVAHNDKDVFHYGKIEEGQQVDSGQPYFKEFKTEKGMKDFLNKKGVEIKDDLISVEDKE